MAADLTASTAAAAPVSAAPALGAASTGPAEAPVAPVPALEARGLTLSWDGEHIVVRDADVHVNDSEIVCMVGRSGCGKTTILHALAGLSAPLEGKVLLHGEDVTGVPGRVSYMFQKDLLLPSKRILDNVCLPLTLRGVAREEAYAKARPLLDRFGLAGTEDKWPSQLSGGMRQRAAFLRTYLMDNDVMLLDEPFSALDAITRNDVRAWFAATSVELGLSALLITHYVDEAVMIAHRIYVLGGAPSEGVPSHIVGEVVVDRAGFVAGASSAASEKEFTLTPAFIEAKRQVLELLG